MDTNINSSYAREPAVLSISRILLPVLVLEFGLLTIFLLRGPFPVIALVGLFVLAHLFYFFYRNSLYAVLFLIFSILPGPIAKVKVAGKIPSFLFLDIALLLAVSVMTVRWLMEWDGKHEIHPIVKSFLLFLLWAGITALPAVDPLRASVTIRNYFSGLVAFLLIYKSIQTEHDVRKIYVALLLWGIILSIMELYNLFQFGGLTLGMINIFLQKNLIATSWGKSNYLAAFDVLLIPIALAVFFTKTSRSLRYLTITALALMTTALIVSLSRGGLAACLVAVSIILARYLRLGTFLSILTIVLVLGLIVFLNPLTVVLLERASEFERSASFYSRIGTWEEAWQIFQKHPFTGVGINNLGYHTLFVSANTSNAHNIVLGLLGETGILGLALFIVLMIRVFQAAIQAWLSAKTPFLKSLAWGILGLLIGALSHAMLEPNFEGYQFSIMVWTCVGLAAKFPYLTFDETISEVVSQANT